MLSVVDEVRYDLSIRYVLTDTAMLSPSGILNTEKEDLNLILDDVDDRILGASEPSWVLLTFRMKHTRGKPVAPLPFEPLP